MEIEKAKEEFRNELIRFKKLVGDLDEKIFRFEKNCAKQNEAFWVMIYLQIMTVESDNILKKRKVNGDEEHNKILDRLNFINMDIHQWCQDKYRLGINYNNCSGNVT